MNYHPFESEERTGVTYKKIDVTSALFKQNDFIPRRYTCDGKNVNPSLNIDHIPKKAASLAIIVDDPDAPLGTWLHWMMWNIPITHHLKEEEAPGIQGMNDFGKHIYSGPCPPKGTHRYFFKVYALDCKLDIPVSSNKDDLEKAMNDHIIGFGELIGLFRRD
ncbi:MAG: YbhB/YbcL family Raf kinase inhibitor-like protein [Chitinophagales bacterium]